MLHVLFPNCEYNARNHKMFVSESQFSCCMYYFQIVNTNHTDRTVMIVLPSVELTEH